MKTKTTQAALKLQALQKRHESYKDFHQTESNTTLFMAANGHPFAEQYNGLRAFFNRLRYACNSEARMLTYTDETEFSEYRSPRLSVSNQPSGDLGKKYPRVFPSDGLIWDSYLADAAHAGWPDECCPRLHPGSFVVVTKNPRLVGRLFIAMDGKMPIEPSPERVWRLHFFPQTKQEVNNVLKVIEKMANRGRISAKFIVKMVNGVVRDELGNYMGEFIDGRFVPSNNLLLLGDETQNDVDSQVYDLPGAPPRPTNG